MEGKGAPRPVPPISAGPRIATSWSEMEGGKELGPKRPAGDPPPAYHPPAPAAPFGHRRARPSGRAEKNFSFWAGGRDFATSWSTSWGDE